MKPLVQFNQQTEAQAVDSLLICCGSRRWAEMVAANRPFKTVEDLIERAGILWLALDESDWLQAFACHPRIGEKKLPTTQYLAFSAFEQSAAQQTIAEVAKGLSDGNRAYEKLFGFRYVVFASGRTAPQLLAILNTRLEHSRAQELREAARQQLRITNRRMEKWLLP